MKKIIFIPLALIVLILAGMSFAKKSAFYTYKIQGKTYRLLTAENPAEREKGLMFYKNKTELKGADGMIFIFNGKDFRDFWNANTYLDLDVYWIDGDRVIGKSHLPPITETATEFTISSPGRADKVIEIVR